MDIDVHPGTYVVAVSGGVDSMALLDLLTAQAKASTPGNIKLVVAHFDHGIRHDSRRDRELVQDIARKHSLPFVYHEGNLGQNASEDEARKARYKFLHTVKNASGARAIITAHHHDDVLETAILNMLRGTGRKGLGSLGHTASVHRPLLHVPKQDLIAYARNQGLTWREDTTNQDTKYLRNHIRHNLLTKFSPEHKQQLIDIVTGTREVNRELDTQLLHYLHIQPARTQLNKRDFVMLPHAVAKEVMAAWLRSHDIRDFDAKTLERLVVHSKTLAPGKLIDVVKDRRITVRPGLLELVAAA